MAGSLGDGPERFAPELLRQSPAARLAAFERRCTIEHFRLRDACAAVLHAVCPPGAAMVPPRLGAMVLVIGPSRVGKTTLVGLVEQQLVERARERRHREPGHVPVVRMTATGPGSCRYDWTDYYRSVLRQVGDPFVDHRGPRVRAQRDLREAVEEALLQRQPCAVIVDEAQHLAKAANGRRVQDQLDHLKSFENRTGVNHILVGTYELRPFRTVSAQLACRSVDVHFPRYDATNKRDRTEFKSVIWALQRQLPVPEEPLLVERHWEFLYARSIGCIGLLKIHLTRALAFALEEEARTVTEAHLRAAAMPEDRLQVAFSSALAGEAELREADGADERLLHLLGLREAPGRRGAERERLARPKGPRPGVRAPARDAIGGSLATQDDPGGGAREPIAG